MATKVEGIILYGAISLFSKRKVFFFFFFFFFSNDEQGKQINNNKLKVMKRDIN